MTTRATVLGVGSGRIVPPGGTDTVWAAPQVPFRGFRLLYTGPFDTFAILRIQAGSNELLASYEGVEAVSFLTPPESKLPGVEFDFGTVNPGARIMFTVRNRQPHPAEFSVAIHGVTGGSVDELRQEAVGRCRHGRIYGAGCLGCAVDSAAGIGGGDR